MILSAPRRISACRWSPSRCCIARGISARSWTTRADSTKSQTKHGFRTADVETILDAAIVFAGRIVEPVHDEARYVLLGVTSGGRHAALVFTRRGDKLRPISCRAMRKREKEAYDAAT